MAMAQSISVAASLLRSIPHRHHPNYYCFNYSIAAMAASSPSGPNGYIQARNEAKITDSSNSSDGTPSSSSLSNNDTYRYFMRTVESRPYYPLLKVDPREERTIIEVARVIVSTWRDARNEKANDSTKITEGDLKNSSTKNGKVTVITGGLTNALFKVDFPSNKNDNENDDNDDNDNNSVLVRIFGAEGMIDRDVETSTFARLCDRNSTGVVHAKLDLIGRFQNGRVETWIPNMRQAHYKFDFKRRGLGMEIARQLARLHYGFCMDAEAELEEVEGGMLNDKKGQRDPALWKVAESWIDELSQLLSHEKFLSEESAPSENDSNLMELFCRAAIGDNTSPGQPPSDTAAKIKESLSNQLTWLKDRVETHHPNAPIVFCHNDVNAANVLLHSSINKSNISINNSDDDDNSFNKESVAIIDYEYGSINYAMYDVANFECEHCGGNDNGVPNFELLPGEERQRRFLEEYVRERNEIRMFNSSEGEDDVTGGSTTCNSAPAKEEEVSELCSQVRLFRMASNLYWGIWGILQAAGEVVADGSFAREDAMSRLEGEVDLDKWDNLRYGKNRLERYRVCKERMVLQNNGS